MTASNDDRLDQYMKGEDRLSQLYRAGATEQSPAELDAAILAKAAEARPRPQQWRWLPAVAVAATLVLSLSVVLKLNDMPETQLGRIPEPTVAAMNDASPATVAEKSTDAIAQPQAEAGGLRADEDAALSVRRKKENMAAKADQAPASPSAANAPAPPFIAQRSAPFPADRQQAESDAPSQERPLAAAEAPAFAKQSGAMDESKRAELGATSAMLSEEQKIERLIAYVRNLRGARFIRNDEPHTAAEAADHLAEKRRNTGGRIKTAADFVKYCATESSLSGKLYRIRYPDGSERAAADVLNEELRRLERSSNE